MMRINKDNYEAYILEYSEGNLSVEKEKELFQFLKNNPELSFVLEDCDHPKVSPENLDEANEFTHKKNILRNEEYGLTELEMLLIGKIENTLEAEDKLQLELELLQPTVRKELAHYEKTILKEEHHLNFNKKSSIRKQQKTYWYRYASIAAVSLSIAMFWFSALQNSDVQTGAPKQTGAIEKKKDEGKKETSPRVLLEKNPSSELQIAESIDVEKAATPSGNPLQEDMDLLVKADKRGLKTLRQELRPAPIPNHILPQATLFAVETPQTSSEYISLTDLVKNEFNNRVLKNTVKFELSDGDERKGFALSMGGFEIFHSSN